MEVPLVLDASMAWNDPWSSAASSGKLASRLDRARAGCAGRPTRPVVVPESEVAAIYCDGDSDGVLICRSAERAVRAQDARLRAIDLIDNPELEYLDLTACSTPVHLAVRGCPRLACVRLPEGAQGAILHWEFGTADAAVRIEGALTSFDSCQQDGHTCRLRSSEGPFSRTLLVAPGSRAISGARDIELLVHLDPVVAAEEALSAVGHGLRAVHLHAVSTPRSLNLGLPTLRDVQLVGLSSLENLWAGVSMLRLEITQCPRLRSIIASGHALRVARSAGDDLTLTGVWDHAHFTDVSARLNQGVIATLQAQGCRFIRSDAQTLSNATAPLAGLPHADAIHEPYWREMLKLWVRATEGSSDTLGALRILQALLDTGETPEEIWTLRCALHHRHTRIPSVTCGAAVIWSAPRDLSFETHEADFALWASCGARGADVTAYSDALTTMVWSQPMGALARAAQKADVEQRETYLLKLAAAIDALMHGITYREGLIEPFELSRIGLARMIEALLVQRDHALASLCISRLPLLIRAMFSDGDRITPLRALSRLGLPGAASELLHQARKLTRSDPELAARFLAAGLEPVQSDLLSHIRSEEIPNAR